MIESSNEWALNYSEYWGKSLLIEYWMIRVLILR